MSLDSVIQRILAQGSAEAKAVADATRAEVEKLLQETREDGQRNISRRIEDARKAAERMKLQEAARADLESRKIALAAQKEVLDSVRAEVLRRLGSPQVRSELMRTLLSKSEADWRSGKIFCSPADEMQVKTIAGSRFGGTIDCAGGLVIESEDGARKTDMTFETILQDIWEDSVKELAELLWPRR